MVPTSKLRMTRQRRTIIRALEMVESHPTADEVYEAVRRELPRISLGTVYRNLDVLSEHGIIRKLEFGGSQRRFDGMPNNHYHLRCTGCGRLEDAPLAPLAELEESLKEVSDYEIVGHRLEFIGLCPKCKQKEQGSDRAD